MSVQSPEVSRSSIRVAFATMLVVAGIYLVIAVGVYAMVTQNLTGQIDAQLTGALQRASHLQPQPGGEVPGPGPGADRPFDAQPVAWVCQANGTVVSSREGAVLPASLQTLNGSATTTIGSTPFRLLGTQVASTRVIVGLPLSPVSDAQDTIVQAELIIAPILLAFVFLGAVAIGRRVAAPVERARIRQLEFTADASHELRTPLAVIEAQTSLALSQPRDAGWYKRGFERIDAESRRMRRLVEDLLWLARFDATGGRATADFVDVGTLAAQAADRFAAVAETRHLSLRVRVATGGQAVKAPPEWLDRLLGVLLDNACKYSSKGGSVEVQVGDDAGRVRVQVDDSGPGIPEAERGRIFDRFHRATSTGSGAGLGLAIADAIARATAGRWRIGVSPAGGASIAVIWPRAIPASRTAVLPAAPASPAVPTDGSAQDAGNAAAGPSS